VLLDIMVDVPTNRTPSVGTRLASSATKIVDILI
jgi:hypothetical protein